MKKASRAFMFCFVAGPPIGALCFSLLFVPAIPLLGTTGLSSGPSSIQAILLYFLLGIPFSYIIGCIPAAIGGMLLSGYCYIYGRPSFWVPLGILLVPVILPLFMTVMRQDASMETLIYMGMVGTVVSVPSLICWFYVSRFVYPYPK
jgi:hypothetical protein